MTRIAADGSTDYRRYACSGFSSCRRPREQHPLLGQGDLRLSPSAGGTHALACAPVRFGYTIVYVRDVAASVEFYEKAFGLERRLLHESGQYAELETGSTALAFASHELAVESAGDLAQKEPAGFEVCL